MTTNGHSHPAPPILLTIAGFDPCCGAGTAADLKTFAAHGCYGVAAITSLTVQNTFGVESVHNTPSAELRAQLEALAKDCDIAAVKIGMLGNRGNAVVVAEFLDAHKFTHVVHDPVMKSSGGTERATDVLFDGAEMVALAGEKANEDHLHGTGCTFASALTAQLAAGRGLLEAATLSKVYVTKAIEKAYHVGKGRLPESTKSPSRPAFPPRNPPPPRNWPQPSPFPNPVPCGFAFSFLFFNDDA